MFLFDSVKLLNVDGANMCYFSYSEDIEESVNDDEFIIKSYFSDKHTKGKYHLYKKIGPENIVNEAIFIHCDYFETLANSNVMCLEQGSPTGPYIQFNMSEYTYVSTIAINKNLIISDASYVFGNKIKHSDAKQQLFDDLYDHLNNDTKDKTHGIKYLNEQNEKQCFTGTSTGIGDGVYPLSELWLNECDLVGFYINFN